MFHNGPQTDGREKGQGPHNQHGADEQQREGNPGHRKTAGTEGYGFFAPQASGQGQHRHDQQEATDERGQSQGQVIPGRVSRETRKGAAIIADARGKGIENFAETMGPAIGRAL